MILHGTFGWFVQNYSLSFFPSSFLSSFLPSILPSFHTSMSLLYLQFLVVFFFSLILWFSGNLEECLHELWLFIPFVVATSVVKDPSQASHWWSYHMQCSFCLQVSILKTIQNWFINTDFSLLYSAQPLLQLGCLSLLLPSINPVSMTFLEISHCKCPFT